MKNSNETTYTLDELQGGQPKTWAILLATFGLLVIALGTLLPIFSVRLYTPSFDQEPSFWATAASYWKYIYSAGALCFLVGKLFTPYTGKHPRIKRLYRIESWSAVFFCVAAAFLYFIEPNQPNSWGLSNRDVWAFTLAGGALLIFTSIAIPRVVRKELKKNGLNNAAK
jgi:hypothetical protein